MCKLPAEHQVFILKSNLQEVSCFLFPFFRIRQIRFILVVAKLKIFRSYSQYIFGFVFSFYINPSGGGKKKKSASSCGFHLACSIKSCNASHTQALQATDTHRNQGRKDWRCSIGKYVATCIGSSTWKLLSKSQWGFWLSNPSGNPLAKQFLGSIRQVP